MIKGIPAIIYRGHPVIYLCDKDVIAINADEFDGLDNFKADDPIDCMYKAVFDE